MTDADETMKSPIPEGMLDVTDKFQKAKPGRVPGPRGTVTTDAKDVKAESSTATGVTESSPDSPEKASSTEPEHKSEKAANRYKELNDEVQRLRSELERERAEAQKLREASSPAEILKALKAERPDGYDEWSEDERQAYVAAKAAKHESDRSMPKEVRDQIRRVLLKDLVMDADPNLSRAQAAVVAEVLDQFDNRMPVDEAAAVAARRNPELFAQNGQKKAAEPKPKADPAAFHAQAPGRSDGNRMTAQDRREAELTQQAYAETNWVRRSKLVAEVNAIRAQRRR